MKINGKWKFNSVSVAGTDYMLFDFISNNQRFIGVDTGFTGLLFITHFDEMGMPYGVNFVDDDYNLVSEYSTISIIGEAEVDKSLIINFEMEKISDVDTILMEHPKGIKLLTKGKKCTEDIEVVPTFIETCTVTFDLTNLVLDGPNGIYGTFVRDGKVIYCDGSTGSPSISFRKATNKIQQVKVVKNTMCIFVYSKEEDIIMNVKTVDGYDYHWNPIGFNSKSEDIDYYTHHTVFTVREDLNVWWS